MFNWFGNSLDTKKIAQNIYEPIVAQARSKVLYADFGIIDSPTGRFDMVVVHLFLVLQRLKSEGEASNSLAQNLIETFITDMDYSLREMGVGDLSVGKKVRKMNTALFGRLKGYGQSIESAESGKLEEQIERSIYSSLMPDSAGKNELSSLQLSRKFAGYMKAAHQELKTQHFSQIARGDIKFPDPMNFTHYNELQVSPDD